MTPGGSLPIPSTSQSAALDRAGDMVLSMKELSAGEMNRASLARARRLFDLMDRDKDNLITFDEFRRRAGPRMDAHVDGRESSRFLRPKVHAEKGLAGRLETDIDRSGPGCPVNPTFLDIR